MAEPKVGEKVKRLLEKWVPVLRLQEWEIDVDCVPGELLPDGDGDKRADITQFG